MDTTARSLPQRHENQNSLLCVRARAVCAYYKYGEQIKTKERNLRSKERRTAKKISNFTLRTHNK